MYFFESAGALALGSRLRRLADLLTADAGELYGQYGVGIDARWFPAFYTLMQKGQATITEIADDIGQSHAAVSQVAKQMQREGLVNTQRSSEDGRKTQVLLTTDGQEVAARLQVQCDDVGEAAQRLLADLGVDFWAGLHALEQALSDRSLVARVHQVRKQRLMEEVKIVPFKRSHASAFRELNLQWSRQHWEPEAADYQALDRPQANIINRGGYIAIALLDDQVVGTCALLKLDDVTFELAKMAVAVEAKGRGIGEMLGKAVIMQARKLGARRVYLESNTILTPALKLYRKLGFETVTGQPSPYERCNIQMALVL